MGLEVKRIEERSRRDRTTAPGSFHRNARCGHAFAPLGQRPTPLEPLQRVVAEYQEWLL